MTILAGSFPGIHGLLHHATGLFIISWGAGGGLAVVFIQILVALSKDETVWPWSKSGKKRYLVRSVIWIALSALVAFVLAINVYVSAFLSGIGGVGFLLLLTGGVAALELEEVVAMGQQDDPAYEKAFKWLEETLGFGPGGTTTVLLLLVVFALILSISILAAFA